MNPPRLPLALTLAALVAATASAQVRVRQGSIEFPIEPLAGAASVNGFYAYDTLHNSSAATGLEQSDTSLLFLYRQTGGPDSLVVIHDRYDDGSGGNTRFTIGGLPTGAAIVVKDEPMGDTYSPIAGGSTTASWNWNDCCTDGLAIQGVGAPYCVSVDPSFLDGINLWQVLSGPFPVTRSTLPSLSQNVYLCADCQTLTCPALITAECSANGTASVVVTASGASLCGGDVVTNDRTGGGADASGVYPLGTTTVTFTLSDAPGFTSTCTTAVVVQDTTPPQVVTSGLDGRCLWPPDHKFFCIDDVTTTIEATDACDAVPPTVTVIGCTSNQPDDAPGPGNGDGHTTGDCRITNGGRGVCLRSEREGTEPGDRVYTVTVVVSDPSGNATTTTATVSVPHDQSPHRDCDRPNAGR